MLDEQELESVTGAGQVERHDVAEVVCAPCGRWRSTTADTLEPTSRFVIVHGCDTAGCGIALEALGPTAAATRAARRFAAAT